MNSDAFYPCERCGARVASHTFQCDQCCHTNWVRYACTHSTPRRSQGSSCSIRSWKRPAPCCRVVRRWESYGVSILCCIWTTVACFWVAYVRTGAWGLDWRCMHARGRWAPSTGGTFVRFSVTWTVGTHDSSARMQ